MEFGNSLPIFLPTVLPDYIPVLLTYIYGGEPGLHNHKSLNQVLYG